MLPERAKTLEALQVATQMEIDGREYYQKVSRSSDNQLGRQRTYSIYETAKNKLDRIN